MKEPQLAVHLSVGLGSVLSRTEIEALCRRAARPLIHNVRLHAFKPAAYDAAIANDGLIGPDGRVFGPHESYNRPLVLEPGDTAFVSTHEIFDMPGSLTGTISIKGALARQGLLLLTGLVIDPHYRKGGGEDGRLHFTLANLGGETVVIEPQYTSVVTVQFVRTTDAPPQRRSSSLANVWDDKAELRRLKKGLGFIADLRDLREEVAHTRERLKRQSTLTEYALIAGLFLLGTTILGVSAASILSAASDHHLVQDVKHAIPGSPGKRVFLMVMVLSAAWIIYSISQATVHRLSSVRSSSADTMSERAIDSDIERSAVRAVRVERLARRTLGGVLLLWMLTVLVFAAIEIGSVGKWWWAIPIVVGLLALIIAKLAPRYWQPIRARELYAMRLELYERSSPTPPTRHGGW